MLEVVKEPMFILLLCCGVLYIVLGDYSEGVILLCWVIAIIFITFYQQRKTEKSLEALRQLSSPRALVIRDGQQSRISGREVVPGDIILLNEGDRVPADAILLESNYLTLDESLLTGESMPVVKTLVENQGNNSVMVYSGTLVVHGRGVATVVNTATKTQFGKIGVSLQAIDQYETRLQREMKILIRNLFIGGAVISTGVVTAFYLTRGNFLQSLLNGLAAAMALLPEEFPVVLTVFLALGAWRLSKNKVLTRKPSAIETLGSATVLCSDKTGTITQNNMEVAELYCCGLMISKSEFDTQQEKILMVLTTLFHASTSDPIDPMEKAISEQYRRHQKYPPSYKLLKEYPLSKNQFVMSRVLMKTEEHTITTYCKGAPEGVFSLCNLSESESTEYHQAVHSLAEKGYRVLAAAKCEWKGGKLPERQSEFSFSFVGLVGFEDPIRPEVPRAIEECHEAGIKVIMITGDYPATAISVAEQIGLKHHDMVLTGEDLKDMSMDELKEKINHIHVFARIIPEQKLQIIQALKENGEVVAMTGDGVNDAPALKAADIGVSMGLKGTDVAREASSLVLLDDNFASIVSAIRSGRKIFDNLQKAMSYIMAIHIPIIGLVLLPAFFPTLPLLMMPIHIVFMELIIDPICSIAFEAEQEEEGIMRRTPRKSAELFFGWRKILYSLVRGMLLLAMVVVVYFLSLNEGHTDDEVRTIAFSSLIIGNVFLILASLSNTRSFISVLKEKNVALIAIAVLAILMLILAISIPALQRVFNFGFPGFKHFISAFLGALILLFALESAKLIRKIFLPG